MMSIPSVVLRLFCPLIKNETIKKKLSQTVDLQISLNSKDLVVCIEKKEGHLL